MKYNHFSVEEREKIYLGVVHKESIHSIATRLKRSPSSVSREITRNIPEHRRQYSPRLAEERAVIHRTHRGRSERLKNAMIRTYVIQKLKSGYSPEQIAGRIRTDHGERISHEAIYQFVYAQVHRNGWGLLRPGKEDLRPYLKRRHKRRVTKGLRGTQKVPRFKGNSIDLRPSEVDERIILGHWEGDSVVSSKSTVGLNTLVERVSGLVLITKIKDGAAKTTRKAVTHRLQNVPPALRKTITVDNGSENAEVDRLWEDLPGLSGYLAHPYHSWERGTNENTNGLIRWYFPKGTDFAKVTDDEIALVEYALNHRPRKRLNWRTPVEVFQKSVALQS